MQQKESNYYWDRILWQDALDCLGDTTSNVIYETNPDFKEIFIGHTPTTRWGKKQPKNAHNIYNLDTDAGDSRRLTIMEIETKEYWQSDSHNAKKN